MVSDYPGHYFPMVPLGWALQAAGHQVRLVCGPAQAETASRTGFPVVARGTDVDTALQARLGYYQEALAGHGHPNLPPLHPLTGQEMGSLDEFDWAGYQPEFFARAAVDGRDRTRAIAGLSRQWQPDLVIHDLLSPEALVAAHVANAPAVCHLWGPTGTHETGYGLERLRPDVPAPVRERLGIDPAAELLRFVIDPCPAPIAPSTTARRLPVRYVPYNGAGTLGRPAGPAGSVAPAPAAVSVGKQRVCVVWSNSLTSIFGAASFVVPAVVAAVAELAAELDLELELALSAEDGARLGPLPANTRLLGRYPLSLLLPGAAAVVHHGGAGCLMTAMSAGVPQLALPFGAEQEMIARRLAGSGAGTVIRGSAADPATIAAALRELLTAPGYRSAAAELATRNAQAPTPAALVDELVALVERAKHPADSQPADSHPADSPPADSRPRAGAGSLTS